MSRAQEYMSGVTGPEIRSGDIGGENGMETLFHEDRAKSKQNF